MDPYSQTRQFSQIPTQNVLGYHQQNYYASGGYGYGYGYGQSSFNPYLSNGYYYYQPTSVAYPPANVFSHNGTMFDPYNVGGYYQPTGGIIDDVYVIADLMNNDMDNDAYENLLLERERILDLINFGEQLGYFGDGMDRVESKAQLEDTVAKCVKTRIHCSSSSTTSVNPNETAKEDTDDEGEMCVICQGEYEDKETIGTLVCGHEYHHSCIKEWLMRKKKDCPICRASVLPSQQ